MLTQGEFQESIIELARRHGWRHRFVNDHLMKPVYMLLEKALLKPLSPGDTWDVNRVLSVFCLLSGQDLSENQKRHAGYKGNYIVIWRPAYWEMIELSLEHGIPYEAERIPIAVVEEVAA